MILGRRAFLNRLKDLFGLATLASASGLFASCGSTKTAASSGLQPIKGGSCSANGGSMGVAAGSDGHTHSAPSVSAADMTSGTQKSYTLGSTEAHIHTVTLSAANFTTLQGNQGITLTTDADSTGHTHSIVVNCG